MNRRQLLKNLSLLGGMVMLPNSVFSKILSPKKITRTDFGNQFRWGVAMAAFQNEGAWNIDGKGESIWDRFNHTPEKIKDGLNADVTCDFYHRYKEDIQLAKDLGFDTFRMSIAWTRIFPKGVGEKNQKGIDFYHRVFDTCKEIGIEPFVTLYHWDLPQALEDQGGWKNRAILDWFSEYTEFVTHEYGQKIKNWCVMNEPVGFVGLGYVQGYHAPGKSKIMNLFPSLLHAALCQAEGGRIIRRNIPNAYIGTTLSCAHVDPENASGKDVLAARKIDAFLNRTFVEPLLGLGFPTDELPFLKRINKHMHPDDNEKLKFDFDFIGLQYYFRVVGRYSMWMPAIHANQVPAIERNVPTSTLDWEIYPEGMYHVLKKFSSYSIKEIIITENGCCFKDNLENGRVHDKERIEFFENYLSQLLRAKNEGVNVKGYFVWTLTDNFEWTDGYNPRFGLAYTDYQTQKRYIKDSGYWFQNLLKGIDGNVAEPQ